jgi:hypothetical protein
MKISRKKLEKIIREELQDILNEEQVDEKLLDRVKKAAMAGVVGLGLMSNPAAAAKPVAQGTEQVSTIKDSILNLVNLQSDTYSVNYKSFDSHINGYFNQVSLGHQIKDFEVVYKNTQSLLKDINTLIKNQEGKPEEANYKQQNIKIQKAAEALLKRLE